MTSFEEMIEKAIAEREIPHAVVIATNKSGTFTYAKAVGPRSLRDGDDQSPVTVDAIMRIASCTKLLTSISAMQCVERGLLKLDDPVYDILPELKDKEILIGFDEHNKPKFTKHTVPMTLRHLLTHTSGLSYDALHPLLIQWRASRGESMSTAPTVEERFDIPLVFEPGTQWMYGCSTDWAGKMVERVNGNITLEQYMTKNIWEPLGIKDMTFQISTRPDMRKRLVAMSSWDAETGKVHAAADEVELAYEQPTDCMGGQGLWSCASEYIKILYSILVDDEKLLKKATVEEFFKPQLNDGGRATIEAAMENEQSRNAMGSPPVGAKIDWGLGGLLFLEDIPGWRQEHTMVWGGLPNLVWWIDHKGGLAGCYFGQLVPHGSSNATRWVREFEMAMYERSKV